MIFAPSNVKDFLFKPGKYFLIPEFQRPYSWNSENIQSYIEDLEQIAAAPGEKKHYFGSIVFVNDSKDLNAEVVIDGQQRLTTSLLMLMALYHLILERPERSAVSAEEIRDKYLFNSASYAPEENRIRLKTVTVDDRIFNKLYAREELTADEKQSKLYRAYSEFYGYLSTRTNLEKYVNTLARFDIVTIALNSSDDNPQRVFESINSTGQPLTSGDKIRNFALMLNSASDQEYVYTKYWQKIESALTDVSNDYITDFFRAYLIAKRGATIPLGGVYPEFKKMFGVNVEKSQPRDQLDAFYGDIAQYLEYFRLAKFGTDESNRFCYVADFFMRMRYLQLELFYPFAMNLLAAADNGQVTTEEVGDSLNLVKIFFSRRIVCNIPVTGTDKLFASLHRDVLDHRAVDEQASYFEILKYLVLSRGGTTKLPRDSELDYAVAHNDTYWQKKSNVTYLLASPGDESKESDVVRQIAEKKLSLSIEHIMPQTLNEKYGWQAELGDNWQRIHGQYLHKLANLTLTGYNSEYSNRSFGEKKAMKNGFNDSPLVISTALKSIDKWTEVELIERQGWWQAKLKEIWPVPTTSYRPVEIDTKVWLFDDINLKGTQPRVLHLEGDEMLVSSWAETLDLIVERIFELNSSIYEDKIASDELLARYIRDDASAFFSPEQIGETKYCIEMNTDTNTKRRIAAAIARLAGWSRDDLTVELAEPLESGADRATGSGIVEE